MAYIQFYFFCVKIFFLAKQNTLLFFIFNKKLFSVLKKKLFLNASVYLPNQKIFNESPVFDYFFKIYTENNVTNDKFLKFLDLKKKTNKYIKESFYALKIFFFFKKSTYSHFRIKLKSFKKLFFIVKSFFLKLSLLFIVFKSRFCANLSDCFFFYKKNFFFINRTKVEVFFNCYSSKCVEMVYLKYVYIFMQKIRIFSEKCRFLLQKKTKKTTSLKNLKKQTLFFKTITYSLTEKNIFFSFFFVDFSTLSVFVFKNNQIDFDKRLKYLHFYLFNLYFWKKS